MIVYNETFVIEEGTHQAWLHYMQQQHIPAVMATGHFSDHKILTVLDSPNEGVTYCVQYLTDDIEQYKTFSQQHLHHLHTLHHQRFENKYVLFNSLMQTID